MEQFTNSTGWCHLRFEGKTNLPTWPYGATHLILDYISTLFQTSSVSPLQGNRSEDENTNEFELHGHVQFPTPQNMLSDPFIIIRVRATFFSEEGKEELSSADNRYMYSRIALIPCIYLITIPLAFFISIKFASIFPIIIAPAVVLLAKVFSSKKRIENRNL